MAPLPRIDRRLLAALALTACTFAPASAQGVYHLGTVSTDAFGYAFGQGDTRPNDSRSAYGSLPVGPVVSSNGFNATGAHSAGGGALDGRSNARARAEVGGVHVFAASNAEVINGDPLGVEYTQTRGFASGVFVDYFLLNVPAAPAGAPISVTASIRIDGSVNSGGGTSHAGSTFSSSASWTSSLLMTPASGGPGLYERSDSAVCSDSSYGSSCNGGAPGLVGFSFVVSNQTQVRLQFQASVNSFARIDVSGGGHATAVGEADLYNTMAWGGIQSVQSPAGDVYADYAAVSASSGFDYRNAYVSAVPEPGPALLWLCGLALLTATRLRRSAVSSRG